MSKLEREFLSAMPDYMKAHWGVNEEKIIFDFIRSWAEHILIELRHIRANAPLTVGDKGKTRGRLDELIKKIEEAIK